MTAITPEAFFLVALGFLVAVLCLPAAHSKGVGQALFGFATAAGITILFMQWVRS